MTTTKTYPFPHERLDAWHIARRARKTALVFTASLPVGLGDPTLARQFCQLEARVGAMLTGLIRRHRR
ncbi:MAG: hypothetical protein JRJ84_01440 [Deltaproteobacteria bacterium]|nr:hypothetical protein [Deltaproteobacteria bacterium]